MSAREPELVASDLAYERTGFFETRAGVRYRFAEKKGQTELQVDRGGDGAWARAWPPVSAGTRRAHSPSPDGRSVLLGVGKKLVLANLTENTAETLGESFVEVRGVAWVDDAHALVLYGAFVHFADTADRANVRWLRSEVHYEAERVFTALGGRLVVFVRSARYAHRTVLFARVGERFYRFAEFEEPVEDVFEREERVYAVRGGACLEVRLLENALDEAIARSREGEAELEELGHLGDDDRVAREAEDDE